jgi:hypothetical protein
MDSQRKKELKELASKEKSYMGVYRIVRKSDGKVFVGSSRNLKNQWARLSMQLNTKAHPNQGLQKDWTELGEGAFAFEILEEKDSEGELDAKSALSRMEREWAEQLEAYGESGYNKRKSWE